jgi:hypothetical protein
LRRSFFLLLVAFLTLINFNPMNQYRVVMEADPSIAGGLIVSQLLTLYTTPLIYVYLDRFQDWYRSKRRAAPSRPRGFQSDVMT